MTFFMRAIDELFPRRHEEYRADSGLTVDPTFCRMLIMAAIAAERQRRARYNIARLNAR